MARLPPTVPRPRRRRRPGAGGEGGRGGGAQAAATAATAARHFPRPFLALLLWVAAAVTLMLPNETAAVKHQDFKTCSQSSFCRRQRGDASVEARVSTYSVVPGSLKFTSGISRLSGLIRDESTKEADGGVLSLTLDVLGEGKVLRLRVDEENGLHRRYTGAADHVLLEEGLAAAQDVQMKQDDQKATLLFPSGNAAGSATITYKPFGMEVSVNGKSVIRTNDHGLFRFERYKRKPDENSGDVNTGSDFATKSDAESEAATASEPEGKDAWEETFKGFLDTKPKGPSSIGLDFTFPGSQHVYGIPEHATSFALKSTRGPNAPYTEPYRLYNLDVFEYELDSPMALYGSIPYMVSHKKGQSAGLLWLNSAETWVDVWKSSSAANGTHTFWMSESGVVDAFILLGPSPHDLSTQYAGLTGFPELPPSFSIGYHQCRWNYLNERDVLEVDAGFDRHETPYDVLWLDIEHTDGKRYFTWDADKFPEPAKMLDALNRKGRKLVTIVDPHVKRDNEYHVYSDARSKDLFVKTKEGKEFEGSCWPGSSCWLDCTNPAAREWLANNFVEYIAGKTNLFTWNDMNEPSVFSGPEITMPKDVIHFNGVEHRDVHNLFGQLFHQATHDGLVAGRDPPRRSFVLSRAFFAGSQRWGAIWTGDNFARWEHLAASAPMILSVGIAGLPFAGADVGGYFGDPENELLVRWYQAGVFQPFFRAHAHIDTKRREPWLLGEPYTSQIRAAVRARYVLLPLWYTLFWKASVTGVPVMRPMFMEFPDDESMFAVDDQWMVGESLCVKPVVSQGATTVEILLPGPETWYDYFTFQPYQGPKATVATPLQKIPVFMRGGTAIPRRERFRRSSDAMRLDPITWVVALDSKGWARGELYLDDGETFAYKRGESVHVVVTFSGGATFRSAPSAATSPPPAALAAVRVERLVVIGLDSRLRKAVLKSAAGPKRELEVTRDYGGDAAVVKDPRVWVGEEFEINFT